MSHGSTPQREIQARLTALRERIAEASKQREHPSPVCMVAVSKRHSIESIRAAYAAGQRDFGENFAQELEQKRQALADLPDIRWHFIGAIQRNKARRVMGSAMLHTIDRPSLIQTLARHGTSDLPEGNRQPVLVQVNFGEPQKAGVLPEHLNEIIERVLDTPALELRGLMTLPPQGPPEATRSWFRTLYSLLSEARETFSLPPQVNQLSMGMSADFDVAVEEGSTIVRVGTALFGPRPPAKKT